MPRRFAWAKLPDAELLKLRIKDLGVQLEGTWLEECVDELHAELGRRGIRIRPHAWLSDEWFSSEATPGIAVPFYLAHPRLMRLERKKIIDVEGGSKAECMRILRHEAGHVMQHAYQLQRRRQWQKLFGRSSTPYPKHYRPNPASRNYVQHLRLWYAQAHPDEDFAETFAVWMTPRAKWRRRYEGWHALKKLEYMDELMEEVGDTKPLLTGRSVIEPSNRNRQTLAAYYAEKQKRYVTEPPTVYDRDLKRIFSDDPKHRRAPTAAAFLRHHGPEIRRLVAKWTGQYQLTLDALLDDMIARSRELKLRASGSERKIVVEFTVLLTAKTVHSLYSRSRRRWFAL
ncbi:MAG TPA: putative zinc-binding metallopeptidase [Candidatus Cybelea sp.]|nr:putative zinc-binding metallopeptidase [Candidatus Cybelea sp.]